MSERLKAAIVGCGGIAQVHAAVLSQLEEAQLVACADIRPQRAQAMAEKTGCRAYASLEELLAGETPDVLHLCTPHPLHTPMAQQAAERGIAVFSEKPPAVSREQWAAFRALEGRVPVGVCFQNRYNPVTQALRKLLERQEYGKILGARAFVTWRRDPPYYTESGWRGGLTTEGGGVLMNQAVHTLDLLVYLLGNPAGVDAMMSNHHLKGVIEVEDSFEARIEFARGVSALFYASTGNVTDSPVMAEIFCEKAALRMEGDELSIRREDGGVTAQKYPLTVPAESKVYWGGAHRLCIGDFYRSILENRPFQNSISGVAASVELLLEAYESARKMRN